MPIAAILTLISGVLQFPGEVLALINALKKTPEEKHQELMSKIAAQADAYSKPGGRPDWDV